MAAIDHASNGTTLADEVLLTDEFVERLRSHARSER
jgi:hypothetical protein